MKYRGLKPVARTEQYLKYGFIPTEYKLYFCPNCGRPLNAGPHYQPNFCGDCGQRVDFSDVTWTEERVLRIDPEKFKEVDKKWRQK